MLAVTRKTGSYRDRRGQIYYVDGRVLRTIMPNARDDFGFEQILRSSLLQLRTDLFDDYSADNFEHILGGRARIVKSESISSSGRTLYWFDNE